MHKNYVHDQQLNYWFKKLLIATSNSTICLENCCSELAIKLFISKVTRLRFWLLNFWTKFYCLSCFCLCTKSEEEVQTNSSNIISFFFRKRVKRKIINTQFPTKLRSFMGLFGIDNLLNLFVLHFVSLYFFCFCFIIFVRTFPPIYYSSILLLSSFN